MPQEPKKKLNIMVGYDVSYTSLDVMRLTMKLAKAFKARLHVVSSVVGGKLSHEGGLTHSVAEHGLQDVKKSLEDDNIDYKTHLLVRGDDPGTDIVDFGRHPINFSH